MQVLSLQELKDPNEHKDPKDPAKDGELFESEEHREKHSDLTSPKETDKIDADELKSNMLMNLL